MLVTDAYYTVDYLVKKGLRICQRPLTEEAFINACVQGNIDRIAEELRRGYCTHINTGAISALQHNQIGLTKFLIREGATNYNAIFRVAVARCNYDIVKELAPLAQITDEYLYSICDVRDEALLSIIFENFDKSRITDSLVYCVKKGYYGMCELCLEHGADTRPAFKHAKTHNIIRLLHRYEQKPENIV
jgi:hypothetical protein